MSNHAIVNVETALMPAGHITGFIQYHVRSGRRKGVICAQYDHKMRQFRIGHSLCARNRGDKFNPVFGREIAMNRMFKRGWMEMTDAGVQAFQMIIPESMDKDYARVIKRLSLIHNKSLEKERVEQMGLVQKVVHGIGNAVRRMDEIAGVDAATNYNQIEKSVGVDVHSLRQASVNEYREFNPRI